MIANAQPATSAVEDTTFAHWRKLVAEELNGADFSALQSRTRDGIVIEPLYESACSLPPIVARGARPWTIVQIVDDPDPDKANRQAHTDLKGGATGLSLRFSGAPSAGGFGLPPDAGALAAALDGVDLAAAHFRSEPHPDGPALARWLRRMVEQGGLAPERADISFGLDPIALAAFVGSDAFDAEACVKTFRELLGAGFRGPFAELDTRVVHAAGASEAQELAAMLGAAVWWLRRLDADGLPTGDALPHFGATLAVDREPFLSIAKLRAARLLWARLLELCRVSQTPLRIHAETSRRMLTRADPPSNLLRNTIAAVAAGVGGADSVAVLPHTSALGLADRAARALALNAQHILIEEAHLHRVDDPAAGAGAVEALTESLAVCAWAEFQALEREGGIEASLRNGAFQTRIGVARNALRAALASGASPLVGATVHRLANDRAATHVERIPHGDEARALAPMSLEALAVAV